MDPPVAGVAALRPWFTGKEEGPRWIRWEAPGSWFTGREEGPSWTRWWQGSQHSEQLEVFHGTTPNSFVEIMKTGGMMNGKIHAATSHTPW